MKKTYEKPVFIRRALLSMVAAGNGSPAPYGSQTPT